MGRWGWRASVASSLAALVVATGLVGGLVGVGVVVAGPIDPPAGAVGSTFKTLAEVEPAIALSTLPGDATAQVVISQPGSYYLTEDLLATGNRSGILVAADHVTIDLRGFSVRDANQPGAFKFGLETTQIRTNIVVRNGTFRGFSYMTLAQFRDSVFADLQIVDCWAGGLEVASARNTIIRHVIVARCGEMGLRASQGAIFESCTVDGGFIGISAEESVVRNCVVRNSTGTGIEASESLVEGCTVASINAGGSSRGQGIRGQHLAQIHNNVVINCSGPGIEVGQNGSVLENQVTLCREGVFIPNFGGRGGNRVESNHLSVNQVGIKINLAGNIVVRNSIQESSVAQTQIVAGNSVGTLRSDPASAGPWDNLITP